MLKYSKITVWKCPFINLWQFSFTCPSYVFRILHSRKIRGSASRSQFKCELYLIRLYHMQWYNNCFSSYSWYLPSLHLSEVTIWIQPFMRLFCSQYHRMNLSKISCGHRELLDGRLCRPDSEQKPLVSNFTTVAIVKLCCHNFTQIANFMIFFVSTISYRLTDLSLLKEFSKNVSFWKFHILYHDFFCV